MKDFLLYENQRNKEHRELYQSLLAVAYPEEESPALIAHHLTFSLPGTDPNEIPSADTLIFDHDIMRRVFGEEVLRGEPRYVRVMVDCAKVDCTQRDNVLREWFRNIHPGILKEAA